jgi:hypothetical protein
MEVCSNCFAYGPTKPRERKARIFVLPQLN